MCIGARRLSFSGLDVLISTPSPEKDSLLGPTVHEKIALEILISHIFFGTPFSTPSPEKDSLLAQTVHEQLAHQILKKEVFFG